jgi:environmental stress-induced protein Ves
MHWKNGKGSTIEIAVAYEPSDAANFAWRLSRAAVDSDGPFSNFPGVDRILTILPGGGEGISLRVGQDVHTLRQLEPIHFSGDADSSSKLLNGSLEDFNVMTKRGSAAARVRVFKQQGCFRVGPPPSSEDDDVDWNLSFLYCIEGEVAVSGVPGSRLPVYQAYDVPKSHALRIAWKDCHTREEGNKQTASINKEVESVSVVGQDGTKFIWVDIAELW